MLQTLVPGSLTLPRHSLHHSSSHRSYFTVICYFPHSSPTLIVIVPTLPSHCSYLTICYFPRTGRKEPLLIAQSPCCPFDSRYHDPSSSVSFLPRLLPQQPTSSLVLKLLAPTVHPGYPFQMKHSSHGISSHFTYSSGPSVSLNKVYIKSICL